VIPVLSSVDWQVRHSIYTHFAATATAPSLHDIGRAAGISEGDAESALVRLADAHLMSLAPGSRNLWMAHPFSAVPTAYAVRIGGLRYWANCAWDVFGITALLGRQSVTVTECSNSCSPVILELSPSGPAPSDSVVHFLVPPRRFWDNIGFT
jgi:hypothetical protein